MGPDGYRGATGTDLPARPRSDPAGWVSPAELLAWQAGRYSRRWELAAAAALGLGLGLLAGLKLRHG
jgi:hypothetical protein